jgi:hypothetical protein
VPSEAQMMPSRVSARQSSSASPQSSSTPTPSQTSKAASSSSSPLSEEEQTQAYLRSRLLLDSLPHPRPTSEVTSNLLFELGKLPPPSDGSFRIISLTSPDDVAPTQYEYPWIMISDLFLSQDWDTKLVRACFIAALVILLFRTM